MARHALADALKRALSRLRALLAHPATAGLSLDGRETTLRRRTILEEKRFLRSLHDEWYCWIASHLPAGEEAVLELGSGAGLLRERIPELIASDVVGAPDLTLLADGRALPFADRSLRAVAMVNVLHHLPDLDLFLDEATRCLRPGGALLMVEPWLTPWSRFVYALLQDEPCRPDEERWSFVTSGPLSGANVALPWIAFARDRARLSTRHPELEIRELEPTMPLCYLLSGGIAARSGFPGWSYHGVRTIESAIGPFDRGLAMFARIHLLRR